MSIFSYPSVLTYVLGAQKNRLIETVLLSVYNICFLLGRVEQLVTCLSTGAYLTAEPGVVSSIPALSHPFVEIDREIISTVILLPSAESFKKGCCQLQAKVYTGSTG